MCKIKNTLFIFVISTCFAIFSPALADELPSVLDMQNLKPASSSRLKWYDGLFPRVAQSATAAHKNYTDPKVLADVELRLERVRETGNPQDILSFEERLQFEANMIELRGLESKFFEYWYLKLPMDAAIKAQKWLTKRNSPVPRGEKYTSVAERLQMAAQQNPLYVSWNQALPLEWTTYSSPQSWGDLLLLFNEDAVFRKSWIARFPQSLPRLKELSQIWSWEDTSVRSVIVYQAHTPLEHWVLHREERAGVPNRFPMNLMGDYDSLVRLEYAPTVFFNRIARIVKNGAAIKYYLEAVEKGRTMELSSAPNEFGTSKKTFRGAELLRKSKSDEFLQRSYVQRGSLNLFLGLRTLQLNQIQDLMNLHPELTLAVGQFGFSVTGGRAQTVSNRTDSPQQQLLKLTATLIDFIEFSKTKDVKTWFKENTQHVLRTILGGVGHGGHQALKEPTSRPPAGLHGQVIRSCLKIFERPATSF